MTKVILTSLFCICGTILLGQISAADLVSKSMSYHDPDGQLAKEQFTLKLLETRPNGADRSTKVYINQSEQVFSIKSVRDGKKVTMQKEGEEVSFLIDDNADLSTEQIEQYRLHPERLEFMVNYYRYLWMSPLVLKDPGTVIHDQVKKADFFGTASLEIKVTYDPAVGKDIWYFYFHPETYALVGYRFYHNEKANDGEYILFSGELETNGIRLPKSRKWYTHKQDRYLGEDILELLLLH